MGPKILVIVMATNSYITYVPFYITSMLHFNKQHDVNFLIFVSTGKKNYLDRLIQLISNVNINIVELDNSFSDEKVCGQKYVLYYRYTLPPSYYENYDYVMVGDVDVVIYKDIFTNRIKYLENASYHGRIRKMYRRYRGIYRFCGTFTFKVKEYLENYREKIIGMTKDKIRGLGIMDEQVVYSIVGDNKTEFKYVTTHLTEYDLVGGFHLGLLRRINNRKLIGKLIFGAYLENLKLLLKDQTYLNVCQMYYHPYVGVLNNYVKSVSV